MQSTITQVQQMFMNNGCNSVMKSAILYDEDCNALIHVMYDSIRVEFNGGVGSSDKSNYNEALKAASDDSWENVQRQQNF